MAHAHHLTLAHEKTIQAKFSSAHCDKNIFVSILRAESEKVVGGAIRQGGAIGALSPIFGNEFKKSYLNNLAKLTRFEPCTVRLGRIDHTSMPPCRDYNWPHFVFILAQREGSNFHRHFAA